jgi:hypothetical protein
MSQGVYCSWFVPANEASVIPRPGVFSWPYTLCSGLGNLSRVDDECFTCYVQSASRTSTMTSTVALESDGNVKLRFAGVEERLG